MREGNKRNEVKEMEMVSRSNIFHISKSWLIYHLLLVISKQIIRYHKNHKRKTRSLAKYQNQSSIKENYSSKSQYHKVTHWVWPDKSHQITLVAAWVVGSFLMLQLGVFWCSTPWMLQAQKWPSQYRQLLQQGEHSLLNPVFPSTAVAQSH